MNIPVVNGRLPDVLATRNQPQGPPRPADAPLIGNRDAAHALGVSPAPAASSDPRSASSLPVHAPPGTDPALWSILTAEERTFFSRQSTSGPLTYLKMMAPNSAPQASAAARGRRLDVRA
ncbi:MAG: hypothetical protein ACYC3L_00490 [Gemmatimonadaceae bacterium]